MQFELEKGKTFRGVTDESQKGLFYKHLRIVISNMADNGRALVIPISTVHSKTQLYDKSCILYKGEHSFLTEEKSYAFYGRAEALNQKDLDELSRYGKLIVYEDVSDDLLKRLQDGARKSDQLPQYLMKYFDEF
ncbi:MAG: hypothetical protein IKP73_05315 [Bacteroidales bacterium]|nr:hypothetical protein [Bacteroidales bacterium]MBR4324927.1 hypothetical protein [Bacteroidales bacterium]